MVKNVGAFKRRLHSVPGYILAEVVPAMERAAEKTCDLMRRLVPEDEGTLRESIGWTWGQEPPGTVVVAQAFGRQYEQIRITIYAAARDERGRPYAAFQEFGTVNMPANPFFFVSYRIRRRANRSMISRAVTRAIKKRGTI